MPSEPRQEQSSIEHSNEKRCKNTELGSKKERSPKNKKGLDDDKDEGQSKEDDMEQSGCTEATAGSASNLALARIRRASTCRVDYRDKSDLNDYESE